MLAKAGAEDAKEDTFYGPTCAQCAGKKEKRGNELLDQKQAEAPEDPQGMAEMRGSLESHRAGLEDRRTRGGGINEREKKAREQAERAGECVGKHRQDQPH